MSMTHRSLMALVLTLDVWDLPLVVQPLACCSYCCDPLFEVLLCIYIVEILGLLETLTKLLHLSVHHSH